MASFDQMIYLDNNATTQPSKEVVDAICAALNVDWANPSSSHFPGKKAANAVSVARSQVAGLISADPEKIVFCSGATEANEAVLRHHAKKCSTLITSAAEHPSICGYYDHYQYNTEIIQIDDSGLWNIDMLEFVLKKTQGSALVAFTWANGETGVLQNAEKICDLAKKHNARCLVDATQVVGRIPLDVSTLKADYLSFCAHKLHGPKGIGVLVQLTGQDPVIMAVGGGQEKARRGGTENVPGIVGLGTACKTRRENLKKDILHMKEMRDRFEQNVRRHLPDITINGEKVLRVPNTSSIMFPGVDGMALVARLEARDVICSQVSACSSMQPEPSPALLAMGLPRDDAFSSVRFAVSVNSIEAEIDTASDLIAEEVGFLREIMV
ncbi:MAG: cysteine desulfurase family protein [Roseovarius sp.]|nr:cysteine desulfurase family protein [Roseovarius sp.]